MDAPPQAAQATQQGMNVVFVASEVAPWSKTGGLADVCGALPRSLVSRGHRVMVVAPRYEAYEEALDTAKRMKVDLFRGEHEVGVFHHIRDGVDFAFVDHPSFMGRGRLYGDDNGTYGDNQFRFTLLARAALEIPLQVPLRTPSGSDELYGEECVFVANDWHTGMVPVYLAAKYRRHGVYPNARCMMVIHNMFHQGVFPPGTFGDLHLHGDWFNALDFQYPEWARNGAYEEEGHSVNFLKGAICTADRVLTVSPGYAWEMTTPEGGWGLDGLLRSRTYHLNGIVNGLNTEEWDPATDAHLPRNFGGRLGMAGKAVCKAALQREMGLPQRADVPLIGFIGRLDYQKGADLLLRLTPWLMGQDVQLVMLGTGEKWLEDGFRGVETHHKDKARGWVGFNVAMSHKITAAADILLMPSRFEPCGLNQLYAMRYGTVPVVHATGGLRDTVENFDPWQEGVGTGWTFADMSEESAKRAIWNAIDTFRNHPEAFRGIQARGMERDMSWEKAAEEYEQAFRWAMMDPPYAR